MELPERPASPTAWCLVWIRFNRLGSVHDVFGSSVVCICTGEHALIVQIHQISRFGVSYLNPFQLPTAHIISKTIQPPLPNVTNPAAVLVEDDEGSDAFDSEDEVMSTSGDETADVRAQRRRSHRPITADVIASNVDPTVPAKDYWVEEDPFPTPEGQPSCIVPPSDDSVEVALDPDADDVSSVSQSASQVVVATVHEEEKGEKKRS